MGPTCSLVYENEPLEKNSMTQPPRQLTTTFLQWRELSISIVQGLVITGGTIGLYQYAVANGYNEVLTRSMVFTALVVANIFLTLTDRSFYYSIFTAMRYRNNLMVIALSVTIALLVALLYIPVINTFFGFVPLSVMHIGIAAAVGFVSVIWFELFKLIRRIRKK
jgi:Ca2+-transporting ATPase